MLRINLNMAVEIDGERVRVASSTHRCLSRDAAAELMASDLQVLCKRLRIDPARLADSLGRAERRETD